MQAKYMSERGEVSEQKEAYADRVAQQQYENAVAMGLPYDVAVQQGQYAMEVSEQEFENKINEKEVFSVSSWQDGPFI